MRGIVIMELKNYMEEIVLQSMDDILKDINMCKCDICKMDIAAKALNDLPPQYVVTKKGEVYSKIKNLKGFAVVSKDYKAKSNAEVEKLFLNKPLEIFDDLNKAISWKDSILNK